MQANTPPGTRCTVVCPKPTALQSSTVDALRHFSSGI